MSRSALLCILMHPSGIMESSLPTPSSPPCPCFILAQMCVWAFLCARLCMCVCLLVCRVCVCVWAEVWYTVTHFCIKDKRVLQQTPTEIVISSAVGHCTLEMWISIPIELFRFIGIQYYGTRWGLFGLWCEERHVTFSSLCLFVWYEYRSNPASLSTPAYIRLYHHSTLLQNNQWSEARLWMWLWAVLFSVHLSQDQRGFNIQAIQPNISLFRVITLH